MNSHEQQLFVSAAVSISFQLGFSSLLLAAARQRGQHATEWLAEFEERVVSDARRMRVDGEVPQGVVEETTDTIVAEFRRIFDSVRTRVAETPSGGVVDDRARRTRLPEPASCCGRD